MAIEFKCNCGSEYRLDDSRAGQEFVCKVCRAEIHLPVGTPRVVLPPAVSNLQSDGGEFAAGPAAAGESATASAAGARGPAGGATDAAPVGTTLIGPSTGEPLTSEQPPIVLTGPEALATESGVSAMRWTTPRLEDVMPAGPTIWWFLRRVLLWAGCAAFLAAPWFTCPSAGNEDVMDGRSLPGWQIVRLSAEGLANDVRQRHAGLNPILASFTDRRVVPTTPGVVTGAMLMSFAPLLYALAVALFPLAVIAAWRRDGKGMHVPFLLCWLALLCYLIGWLLLGYAVPSGRGSPLAFGVTIWVYVMLLALVPMTLLARRRIFVAQGALVVRRGAAPPT